MERTKPPSAKPLPDAARSSSAQARKAPSTSFEETLSTKRKTGEKPKAADKAKSPVLAAIEQAGGDAQPADDTALAMEKLGLVLTRGILQAPKAAKIDIDRAEDPNSEE